MDILILFVEVMVVIKSLEEGVVVVVVGLENIKKLKVRLGRVMYVGIGIDGKELLLDLGVWGVMVVI